MGWLGAVAGWQITDRINPDLPGQRVDVAWNGRLIAFSCPAKDQTQVDARFNLTAARNLTLDGDSPYAGVLFRPHEEVTRRRTEAVYSNGVKVMRRFSEKVTFPPTPSTAQFPDTSVR